MLERYFLKPQTVDRIMACWLGPRIELYVTALCERGYAARSILRRVPILMEFAEFAAARNADRVERAETLLDAFERRTVVGRRDYAMLLLMVTYGLRAREVAALGRPFFRYR